MGYDALYLPAGAAVSAPNGTTARGGTVEASEDPPAPQRQGADAARPPTPAAPRAAAPSDPVGTLGPDPAKAPSSGRAEPAAPRSTPPGTSLDPHDTLFGVPPSGWERFASLQDLGDHVCRCTECRLAEGRHSVVFGSGNPDADLMFIGEGPGAEEDRQGLPFVGPAGALLTKMIEGIDLRRDDVYIANIVKCRPPGNRDPLPDEVAACRGYLERQIDLVAPRVIVALGRVAAQTLLESALPLGRLRGRWHSVRGVAVRATYHPAALLRNSHWKRPTWEDLKVVRDRLAAS